jgi:hypothetical protein
MKDLINERSVPYPTREEVIDYFKRNYIKCIELDLEKEARLFFNYYNGQDWYTGGAGKGRKITNWVNKADSWIEDKLEKARKDAENKRSSKSGYQQRLDYKHDQSSFERRAEKLKKLNEGRD